MAGYGCSVASSAVRLNSNAEYVVPPAHLKSMSDPQDRKHLSLLDSLSPENGEARDNLRRFRRKAANEGKSRVHHVLNSPAHLGVLNQDVGGAVSEQTPSATVNTSSVLAERESLRQPQTGPLLRFEPEVQEEEPTVKLPQRQRRRPLGGIFSFIMCVVVPTIIAAVYYFGYATDQYVVEFRFAVRDTTTATSTSAATTSLTAIIGMSTSTNPTENYMVTEYMVSRQAIEDLQTKINIRQRYALPFIDFWSRLDASEPMEKFARYWKYMTTAEFDIVTGTAFAQVKAFTPDDAYLIATTLLSLSEDLINEVAQRPQMDAVRSAETEVKRAEERLKDIRAALSAYREKEGVIEPTSSVVLSNATLLASMRSALASLQTEMKALQQNGMGASTAQMQNIQVRIKATEAQIKEVEGQVSTPGLQGAVAKVVARYEELDLERQFAQNTLTSTMQSLEQARSNAMSKRLYITPFVLPAMPQTPVYPKRVVAILTVAGACLMLWTIALLLVRSIREHLT